MLTRLKEFFAARQCPAYLVGGYLRDCLLSLTPQRDVDIALSADSQIIGRDMALALGGSFVPLSPAQGKARVVVPDSEDGPWTVDLSNFPGTIEEDLARRDFTINSMALCLSDWASPPPGELIIDPFHGRMDLARKSIRAVGANVFREDPVRLLRAVRLAAGLGFRLEPETTRLLIADAALVGSVARERIRDEFLAILSVEGAKGSLEVLDRLGLLCRVIPELEETKSVEQPDVHYWDVWGHILHTVECSERVTRGHQHSPIYTLVYWTADTEAYFRQKVSDGHTRRTLLKLAALFHDISKPQTKQVDQHGRTRFPRHSETGAVVAAERLADLRFGSRGSAMVATMVENHLRPGHMMQGVEVPTPRAIYRYFRDLEDVAIDTLYLSQADYLGTKGPSLNSDDWANRARMMTHVTRARFEPTVSDTAGPLVDGHELMEHFDLEPGPLIGLLLDSVEEARAAREIASQEEALALAAEALSRHRGGK